MSDNKDFENKVKLVINGNDIELNKFTDDIIKETILKNEFYFGVYG